MTDDPMCRLPENPNMLTTTTTTADPKVDPHVQALATELVSAIDALYRETSGKVPRGHPQLNAALALLAKHGKALWAHAQHDHSAMGRRLKHWLHCLASAPVETWRAERERIKPLIRQVALAPRSRQQPLLVPPPASMAQSPGWEVSGLH